MSTLAGPLRRLAGVPKLGIVEGQVKDKIVWATSKVAGLFRPLPPIITDEHVKEQRREALSLEDMRADIPSIRSSCRRDPAFRTRVIGRAKDWEDRCAEHAARADRWEREQRGMFRWTFVVFLCMEWAIVSAAITTDPASGFFVSTGLPVLFSLWTGGLALFLRRSMAAFAGITASARRAGLHCQARAAVYREAADIPQDVN